MHGFWLGVNLLAGITPAPGNHLILAGGCHFGGDRGQVRGLPLMKVYSQIIEERGRPGSKRGTINEGTC